MVLMELCHCLYFSLITQDQVLSGDIVRDFRCYHGLFYIARSFHQSWQRKCREGRRPSKSWDTEPNQPNMIALPLAFTEKVSFYSGKLMTFVTLYLKVHCTQLKIVIPRCFPNWADLPILIARSGLTLSWYQDLNQIYQLWYASQAYSKSCSMSTF